MPLLVTPPIVEINYQFNNKELRNTKVYKNYDENIEKLLNDSFKNIINQLDIEKIDSAINKSFMLRSNEPLTLDFFKINLNINEDTYISKELKKINLFDAFKNKSIEKIYNLYLNEYNESINSKERCGNFFSSHFWQAVGMEIETNSLWILSLLWWGVQITPPIITYIKNWDSTALADSLASFDISLPSFFLNPY